MFIAWRGDHKANHGTLPSWAAPVFQAAAEPRFLEPGLPGVDFGRELSPVAAQDRRFRSGQPRQLNVETLPVVFSYPPDRVFFFYSAHDL